MKITGLPKVQKWWAELDEARQNLCTSMLNVFKTLTESEQLELIEFMDAHERFASVGNSFNVVGL